MFLYMEGLKETQCRLQMIIYLPSRSILFHIQTLYKNFLVVLIRILYKKLYILLKKLCYFILYFEIFRCGIRDPLLTEQRPVQKGQIGREVTLLKIVDNHSKAMNQSHPVIRVWLCPGKFFSRTVRQVFVKKNILVPMSNG